MTDLDSESKAILKELQRRRALRERVAKHLIDCFTFDESSLTKRDVVHRTVCARMGKTRSNESCLEIRAVLAEMGVLGVNHSGSLFYRGIRHLQSPLEKPVSSALVTTPE